MQWSWKADPRGLESAGEMAAPELRSLEGWKEATPGQDTFGGKKGFAWYRTTLPTIKVPVGKGANVVTLHFESVDDNGTVFLNGKRLAHHEGWNEPFDVVLNAGFNPGFNPNGPNVVADLVVQVLSKEGKVVVETKAQTASGSAIVRLPIAQPKLWTLEDPYLYRLVTRIERDGKTLDETTTSFGVRTVRFDAEKGLFLNGKPVKIQGTCNHQDFAGVGIYIGERLLIEKLYPRKVEPLCHIGIEEGEKLFKEGP